MASDPIQCHIAVLERIINSFFSSGLTVESLQTPDSTEKREIIKLLVSKKLSLQTLTSYNERSANSESEEGTIEELQEEIGKAVAIAQAWASVAVGECIAYYISNDSAERTMKSLLLRKLDNLIKRQSVILELTRQEKLAHTANCERKVELKKELVHYKETLKKKLPHSHDKRTLTEREKKVLHKIEKINVMRKLISSLVLFMDIDFTDERWLNLFTLARDPVTAESFQD